MFNRSMALERVQVSNCLSLSSSSLVRMELDSNIFEVAANKALPRFLVSSPGYSELILHFIRFQDIAAASRDILPNVARVYSTASTWLWLLF
jgi:hypothetical protein